MIKVTIELWPKGFEIGKKLLGEIIIGNDATGSNAVGNYDALLMKRGSIYTRKGDGAVWKQVRVEGFPHKRLGAYDLLYRVLKAAVGGRNP